MPTKALTALPDELRGQTTVRSFDEFYRFAQVCQASGLFEDVRDAAQAFVMIAKGAEMGLAPMSAMQAFDLIKGHVFVKPWVIAGLINSCGYGSYEVLEQSPTQCAIQFRRKLPDKGWTDCPLVTYTLAEAQAHGLVQRSPHWKASPAHMLYQRCMGRGGAMYFPELLAGLEAPPDPAPISPERHADNLDALYGASLVPEAPRMPQDATTPPRTAPEPSPPLERTHEPPERQSAAWETLRAHADDPRLPEELRAQIQAALGPLAPASEGEALVLAGHVLDWLAHGDTERDPYEPL